MAGQQQNQWMNTLKNNLMELSIAEVYNAQQVLRDVAAHPTLVPTNLLEETEVFLKPECLQHTGSFKHRGAYYNISQLTPEE